MEHGKSARWLLWPALLLVLALAFGMRELFQLRANSGEIFAPYSSLRADPMGSRALFEALQELPGLSIERIFQPRAKIRRRDATILFLGTGVRGFAAQNAAELAQYGDLAAAGNRLVITFRPVTSSPREPAPARKPDDPPRTRPTPPLQNSWGVRLAYREPTKAEQETIEQTMTGRLPWSLLYFEPTAPEWSTHRRVGGVAVTVERPWGKGTIVLSSDSVLMSNQQQLLAPNAEELAWIVGNHRTVLFDEAHLGAVEQGSVAGLLRRYHLHGVLGVLLLVTALFVWQSAVPFLPVRGGERESTGGTIQGESAASGFVRLLRRGVPRGELIWTCWREWQRTVRMLPKYRRNRIERATQAASAKGDPLEVYRAIQHALAERD